MSDKETIKVYYNSACPVCKAGIEHQKDKESSCEIQWNDVHQHNNLVFELNSELEFVRERLHVVDEIGKLQVGFAAFLTIWKNSPTEKWKYHLLSLPVIKQFGTLFYNLFATVLYKWNKTKKHW